jgi:hypothetical protein
MGTCSFSFRFSFFHITGNFHIMGTYHTFLSILFLIIYHTFSSTSVIQMRRSIGSYICIPDADNYSRYGQCT